MPIAGGWGDHFHLFKNFLTVAVVQLLPLPPYQRGKRSVAKKYQARSSKLLELLPKLPRGLGQGRQVACVALRKLDRLQQSLYLANREP